MADCKMAGMKGTGSVHVYHLNFCQNSSDIYYIFLVSDIPDVVETE